MKGLIFVLLILALFVPAAYGRDTITIVGSSTVYPFAVAVSQRFGLTTQFNKPNITSTGSGAGFKLFCDGAGIDTPDITNASRLIKNVERHTCRDNGVTDIRELVIGYGGVVIAQSITQPHLNLTMEDVFLALGKRVYVNGALTTNPHHLWSDVNPILPHSPIKVFGPPTTSGTRDAFAELVLERGCIDMPFLQKHDCHNIRTDGKYIEAGENDDMIVNELIADPSAVGIFGYNILNQNTDTVHSVAINGVDATFDAIADGIYPAARALYVYVKGEHINLIPGITDFVRQLTSDITIGDDGYLVDNGLIPLSPDIRYSMQQIIN